MRVDAKTSGKTHCLRLFGNKAIRTGFQKETFTGVCLNDTTKTRARLKQQYFGVQVQLATAFHQAMCCRQPGNSPADDYDAFHDAKVQQSMAQFSPGRLTMPEDSILSTINSRIIFTNAGCEPAVFARSRLIPIVVLSRFASTSRS